MPLNVFEQQAKTVKYTLPLLYITSTIQHVPQKLKIIF